MSGIVAIHQPNFFPWMGYFDKINRADIFVFLDEVDYPRAGSGGMGSWTNRVKLAVQGEARWITCPLQRMPSGSPISAAQICDDRPWRSKLLRTLDANYRKAPHYQETLSLIRPLIERPECNLASFNIRTVKTIAERLGIFATFVRQSELSYEGSATALLISLVKAVGGDSYLAGGGAAGYQEDDKFAAAGLRIRYQSFVEKPHETKNGFIPGLSIINYLMHDGSRLCPSSKDGET